MIDNPSYPETLAAARRVVRDVGEYIEQERSRLSTITVEKKGSKDLVSYVDKQAEHLLVRGLSDLVPVATFAVEEDTRQNIESDLVWAIDPLDGTTNFLHGLPVFSISVALLCHGEPVVGIVYDVLRKKMYSAYENGGAFCETVPVHVSTCTEFSEALVGVEFPYTWDERVQRHISTICRIQEVTHGVRTIGSAALDLAFVAAGFLDGFFEYDLKIWDVAAGILLIREGGGTVTDYQGARSRPFNGDIVASNGALQNVLLDIVNTPTG